MKLTQYCDRHRITFELNDYKIIILLDNNYFNKKTISLQILLRDEK